MSSAAVSENIGCFTALSVLILVCGALAYVHMTRPEPSVACVKAGGTWTEATGFGHCERSPK